MEYTQKNLETEKITFKPRIEEELTNGDNEIGNLANHNNQRMSEDDELYNTDDTEVAVKLTLDSGGDQVQGFIFDTIQQDLVNNWREELSDSEHNIDSANEFGFKSQFPNIYSQSEAIFDAMKMNQIESSHFHWDGRQDDVEGRTTEDLKMDLANNVIDESSMDPIKKDLIRNEKFTIESEKIMLTENEIPTTTSDNTENELEVSKKAPQTDAKHQKRRKRRKRRKPIYDRESGLLPLKKQSHEEERNQVSPAVKQYMKTTPVARNKRKRFHNKKRIRKSQYKKNQKAPYNPSLKTLKYQTGKKTYSYPKIQFAGRPLRIISFLKNLR